MKILVVGGAGYVGSHCVHELIRQGYEPVVLDNLVYGHRRALLPDIPFYEASMEDVPAVRDILRRESIELVMHYAAFAYVGESMENPLKYYLNNTAASIKLLEAMLAEGVTQFILSSSCSVYGHPTALPITEDAPLQPISPYGQTKVDLERCLHALSKSDGLSFASLRYFNAAGASDEGTIGEDHTPETHLIPLVYEVALGKRSHVSIWGTDYDTPDGTCQRDYVHVDDLAKGHILTIDKLSNPGASLVYNLGTGKPHSVREVIQEAEAISGQTIKIEEYPRRAGDPATVYADASKARKELGWSPDYPDLTSIMQSAWDWHSQHPNGFNC